MTTEHAEQLGMHVILGIRVDAKSFVDQTANATPPPITHLVNVDPLLIDDEDSSFIFVFNVRCKAPLNGPSKSCLPWIVPSNR
jgi:hypothetical protein